MCTNAPGFWKALVSTSNLFRLDTMWVMETCNEGKFMEGEKSRKSTTRKTNINNKSFNNFPETFQFIIY